MQRGTSNVPPSHGIYMYAIYIIHLLNAKPPAGNHLLAKMHVTQPGFFVHLHSPAHPPFPHHPPSSQVVGRLPPFTDALALDSQTPPRSRGVSVVRSRGFSQETLIIRPAEGSDRDDDGDSDWGELKAAKLREGRV